MIYFIGHSHFVRLFSYFDQKGVSTFADYRKFVFGGLKLDHLSGPVGRHWPSRKRSLPGDFTNFMASASPGDSVIVFLGDNDMGMGPEIFATKLIAFFSMLKGKYALKSITILPLLPHYEGALGDIGDYNRKALACNRLLRDACISQDGFFYQQIIFAFPGTDRNGDSQSYKAAARFFGPDGVHLNDIGNNKLASSLRFALNK